VSTVTTGHWRLATGHLLLIFILATDGHGQDADGSAWAAAGGAALGLYSGVMLGVLGSLTPCTQT